MFKEIAENFKSQLTKEFICIYDPIGNFEYVEESVERVLGYSPEKMLNTNIYEYLHVEDKAFFEMIIHLPIINGSQSSLNADLRFLKASGTYAWLSFRIIPLKNEAGIVENIISLSNDVTEFMEMKEQYEKKQSLLLNTGQMAQLGAWELDATNMSRVWSKETYEIYEVSENNKPDYESIFKHFPGEAENILRKATQNALEHGVAFDLNLPFVTEKDNKIWVRVMATPKINLGKVVKLHGLIQNIDKEVNDSLVLKSMVRQLTKQNRQLEDFTHILSHNVRGPISSLTTLLTMLESADSPEEKSEIMDMLKMSSKSLEDLLNELKEVINATHVRGIESQENDLEQVINDAEGLLRGEIVQTKATIVRNLEGWSKIYYPKIYLESIVMNLMSNALKYRSESRLPVITIETILVNGLYTLKFSDNGAGIDLVKHKDNIFKLYKTFHPTKPGKGLGLFMTKSQIEAMGGTLAIESQPNVGTTFTIVFNKEKVPDKELPLVAELLHA